MRNMIGWFWVWLKTFSGLNDRDLLAIGFCVLVIVSLFVI